MRLIDSDKCPCRKCKTAYCHSNCQAFYDWLDTPVDAEPVVRCKDCRWFEPIVEKPSMGKCMVIEDDDLWDDDDYCSYAVRKDGE